MKLQNMWNRQVSWGSNVNPVVAGNNKVSFCKCTLDKAASEYYEHFESLKDKEVLMVRIMSLGLLYKLFYNY